MSGFLFHRLVRPHVSVDPVFVWTGLFERFLTVYVCVCVCVCVCREGTHHVPASTLSLIVEFMCFCVLNHTYRMKYYAMRNNTLSKVSCTASQATAHMQTSHQGHALMRLNAILDSKANKAGWTHGRASCTAPQAMTHAAVPLNARAWGSLDTDQVKLAQSHRPRPTQRCP